jgi:hypothetical protein
MHIDFINLKIVIVKIYKINHKFYKDMEYSYKKISKYTKTTFIYLSTYVQYS